MIDEETMSCEVTGNGIFFFFFFYQFDVETESIYHAGIIIPFE